jgi:NAD(P)-dependent dehydrogenase (short-subunit alcohol dehydrogenase family)
MQAHKALASVRSRSCDWAYSTSKWALDGLSRSAAYVYADWGIRSNVVQPNQRSHHMLNLMDTKERLDKLLHRR